MQRQAPPVKYIALTTILLSGIAGPAWAQSADAVVNAGEVNAAGGGTGASNTVGTQVPTPTQVFQTPTTERVVDQAQMQTVGPAAGAAQVFGLTPGAYVNGYGNTGATKYTIALDGIGQGWGGYGGYTGGASLMVTMDGVPMVDPGTGLWASSTMPALSMFQAQQVTYGPGSAADRWYDNIGGNIEFTPNQPTKTAGGSINVTYGSYDTKVVDFSLRTGEYDGWSSILSGSYGSGNSYRTGPDGFANPSDDYAVFGKTVKTFDGGDISFGAYLARSEGYRPQVIPTSPNPQITMNGISPTGAINPGTLYSQKTSGYYSTPPEANYNKFDTQQLWTIYNKVNLDINDTTMFHNMVYYVDENRQHQRTNDAYPQGAANLMENNTPYSYWYGDKASITKTWRFNNFDVGAFVQNSQYSTQNAFFNPNAPYFGSATAPNAKFRSGLFNQLESAVYLQDDISPVSSLHIVPGLRLASFVTNYADMSQQMFPNATGTNQGALANGLPAGQSRSFVAPEPSLEVSYQALSWLNLYGSYEESYKLPQVGGGGGLYQAIGSQYAQLAHAQEFQAGFKVLKDMPEYGLHNFDFGANYFYLRYGNQTITTTNAVGTATTAFGTSDYQGFNMYADDNPLTDLHTFVNASVVKALYSNYAVGNYGAQTSYNGTHVPYTPTATLNIGGDYKFVTNGILVNPYAVYQYTGDQYIFNNVTGAPSSQTLAGYGTLNLGINAKVPVTIDNKERTLDFSLSVLNATNVRYNSYLYLSSGGYYGTSNSGYGLAYPGAPMTIYASVGASF